MKKQTPFKNLSLTVLGLLLSVNSFALEDMMMQVTSRPNSDRMTVLPRSSTVTRTKQREVIIRIKNSCFATNLRSVSNPLAPTSFIHARFSLQVGQKVVPVHVRYPAMTVVADGGVNVHDGQCKDLDKDQFEVPGGGRASVFGNMVQINSKFSFNMNVSTTGEMSTSGDDGAISLVSSNFEQEVTECGGSGVYGSSGQSASSASYNCGSHMGVNGNLSASIYEINATSDSTLIELSVGFPGQTGFCGGFWSPLMIFTSEGRPEFSSKSSFLFGDRLKTSWPEAKAAGYFLVHDKNGNGIADGPEELFGNNEKFSNGFDALKVLDSNNDGVIDKRDKDFKNLYLWHDSSGSGKSKKSDMIKLSDMVDSISLKYQSRVRSFHDNAEERQISNVVFKRKSINGSGAIADIWFKSKPN